MEEGTIEPAKALDGFAGLDSQSAAKCQQVRVILDQGQAALDVGQRPDTVARTEPDLAAKGIGHGGWGELDGLIRLGCGSGVFSQGAPHRGAGMEDGDRSISGRLVRSGCPEPFDRGAEVGHQDGSGERPVGDRVGVGQAVVDRATRGQSPTRFRILA